MVSKQNILKYLNLSVSNKWQIPHYIPEWYQKKVIPVQHWFCVGYLLGILVWNCRSDIPNNQFKQHDRRLQSCLGIASNSKPIHATSPYTFSCWIANVVQTVKLVKIRFHFLSRCLKSCQWYVADNAFIWPFCLCNYDSLYYDNYDMGLF